MLAQTYSYGINALTPFLVTIEVDAAKPMIRLREQTRSRLGARVKEGRSV